MHASEGSIYNFFSIFLVKESDLSVCVVREGESYSKGVLVKFIA